MLQPNPADRIKCGGLLVHPFFKIFSNYSSQSAERPVRISEFRNNLSRLISSYTRGRTSITLERNQIVEGMINYFFDLKTGKIPPNTNISFQGEEGVDAGGLNDEAFRLFFEKIFSPELNVFECDSEGTYLPTDYSNLLLYKAVGQALIQCLVDQRPVYFPVCPSLFKFLLYEEYRSLSELLADVEKYSHKLASNYNYALENDVTILYAQGNDERGLPRDMTESNKREIIRNNCLDLLQGKRLLQLLALRDGFCSQIPRFNELLRSLTPLDLAILLCGDKQIDVSALLSDLDFSSWITISSNIPEYLKRFLREQDQPTLKAFLVSVTNFPVIPPGGFAAHRKGKIKVIPSNDTRFNIHTCFNQLKIPENINDYDVFKIAITAVILGDDNRFNQT